MQLIIKHEANNLTLPLSYHTILQGIIYNNLRSMRSYSGYLHNEGYENEDRFYKLFTFSEIKGRFRIQNKMITFIDSVEWEIRSVDPFMIHTLKENIERNGISYGEQHFDSIECICTNETVEDTTIYIQMESPVVTFITDSETRRIHYYKPNEEEFYYSIFNNFRRKYQSCYFEEELEDIQMAPVKVTSNDKVITKFKGKIIEGYKGIYILKGKRKYLDFMYQVGIGARSSQGFGMFRILSEEEIQCLQ